MEITTDFIPYWNQLESLVGVHADWIFVGALALICGTLILMITKKLINMLRFSKMKKEMFQSLIERYETENREIKEQQMRAA